MRFFLFQFWYEPFCLPLCSPLTPLHVDLLRIGHTRPDLNAESLETAKPDWEVYCAKVADSIVEKQDPERLLQVRSKLYELLSHCIPPVIILKVRSPFAQSCRVRCKQGCVC